MKNVVYIIFALFIWTCSSDSPTKSKISPPSVSNIQLTTNEDSPVLVIFNGSDPQGLALTYSIESNPSNGNFTKNNYSGRYTPNENFHGSDSFTYTASNGSLKSSSATVSITIVPVDDDPNSKNISVMTEEDTSVVISLEADEYDGDSISFSITSNPSNGTVTLSGNQATYSPNENYFGNDSFTFEATDSSSRSILNSATAFITVTPVNDPPVVEDFTVNFLREDEHLVVLNAYDPDGDQLTYSIVSEAENVSTEINENNLTISSVDTGFKQLTFKANDGTADSNIGTISMNIDWKLKLFTENFHTVPYTIEKNNSSFIITATSYKSERLFRGPAGSYILNIDEDGNVIWKYSDEGSGSGIRSGKIHSSGNIILGLADLTADENANFIFDLLSQNGNLLKRNRFNGDYTNERVFDIIETNDSGIVLVGNNEYEQGGFFNQTKILKSDLDGNEIWKQSYGDKRSIGYSLIENDSNELIVVGVNAEQIDINDPQNSYDYYDVSVAKLSSETGEILWRKSIPGKKTAEHGYKIRKDGNGYIILGNNVEEFLIYLIKINENGDVLWDLFLPLEGYNVGYDIQSIDDGFVIVGYKENNSPKYEDVLVIKTNKNGNIMWKKEIDLGGFERSHALQITQDSSILIIGHSNSKSDYHNAFILKLDNEGNRIF